MAPRQRLDTGPMPDAPRDPAPGIRRRTAMAFAASASVGSLAVPRVAKAASYPDKPVTVIVAYPPGGATDMLTRLVADKLGQMLGQPFVILNKPGAGGNIGTAQAAKAPADGYTLVHSYIGTIAINPSLYGPRLPYDPKDLVGIAPMASDPLFLVVPPELGVHSVAELVALAKAKPETLTNGTVGVGSPSHVFAELFKSSAGINVRGIPFNGSGPATNALMGGHISFMFTAGQIIQQVKAGKLIGLATTDNKRSPTLPDLPSIAETIPGYQAVSWHGLFAPAGTPKPIVELLNAKVVEILAQPDMQKKIESEEMNAMSMSTADFARFIDKETAKWTQVVVSNKIQVD